MNTADVMYAIGMAGTVAFAVTAVLAVARHGIDLFGACVMGLVTAIGGGTIRDVILNVPVFWAADLNYIWVALAASLVAFPTNRIMSRKQLYRTMLYVDALGVSLFAIQATHKVVGLDFAMPLGPILLGVITAIGGGLVRDVLSGNTNLLMSRELYAIPVTLGCTLYVILTSSLPGNETAIGLGCWILIFALRAAAIRWNLHVPAWLTTEASKA